MPRAVAGDALKDRGGGFFVADSVNGQIAPHSCQKNRQRFSLKVTALYRHFPAVFYKYAHKYAQRALCMVF